MGFKFSSFLILHCWIFLILILCAAGEVAVKLLNTPRPLYNGNSATFGFQVEVDGNGGICSHCPTNCKLDQGMPSSCEGGSVSYAGLSDGNHSFKVCTNGSSRVACTSYNWTIDTINPTANITADTSFTNASHVTVNISFSEACGGFSCSSVNACNLLVYGAGEVIPNTLRTIHPDLKYSLTVSVYERVRYGRLILVMGKNFCRDSAGNQFTRTENSSLFIHFDRRSVHVNLRTHIPDRLLQIGGETRTVLATNKNKYLKVYLYFAEPVVNSSAEILNSLKSNQGSLVPISGNSFGQRRFGYRLTDVYDLAIVTVSLQSNMVVSRQGTPVSPVPPISFLYDSQRPTVRLSTTCNMRTKEKTDLILVKFAKPVFGFNSSHVSISGGNLQSFQETSRSSYTMHVQAESGSVSVSIPENITADVSGNRNKASNTLQVRHYSVPIESFVLSSFATAVFAITALVAGFLTVSTTSLLSSGAFSRPTSVLCTGPARNIFRIASHLQVFALSRWLAVTLPVEYYELTKGLQWSIPYFNLPWEKRTTSSFMIGPNSPTDRDRLYLTSEIHDSIFFKGLQPQADNMNSGGKVFGLPLTPIEYRSYFEGQNTLPEAEYILDPQNSHGWRNFSRSMFCLSAIGGTLIMLHALLLMIIKLRRRNKDKKSYGALIFPRFEIFLVILALPCICEASAALVKGGTSSGMIVGILLLSLVVFLLLCLLLFLTFGITFGKLLHYKEVHHEGQTFHWYQELIRITLGPGKRGQWTWKHKPNSIYLAILGPLFEDLRGPPKYMVSKFSGGSSNKTNDTIIDSEDETEDAEPPFIQKLFGVLRIYYTLIECVKRVTLGVLAGAYSVTSSSSSRTPTIAMLSITSFQLFFMVLKKPFVKKKVQLVEIISVSCEVTIFAFCTVFLDHEFSIKTEKRIGVTMVLVFLSSFSVQMIYEWYALYRQIKDLDPIENSFLRGLKTCFVGVVLFVCPNGLTESLRRQFPLDKETDSVSAERNEKPWMRQIRDLARSSFGKEGSKARLSEPSTSKLQWSGMRKSKKSGGLSASTSTDFKGKPRGLQKELEDIFATK